ncbi:MAG: hypothetical protein FJ285_00615 [Planctomycetes bacterium]|nr:hypothetical protein [Planctomycetota bacterium]
MSTAAGSKHVLLAQYMALSPLMRYALAGILALVLWLFLEDYCWAPARKWSNECTQIEDNLERCSELRSNLSDYVKSSAVTYGTVAIPTDIPTTREGISKSVDEILRKNGVAKFGYEEIGGGKMPSGAFIKSVGTNRVERCRGEFQVETTAEVLTKLTRDLEQSDSIDAIASITIRRNKDDKAKLTVDLVVEGWANAGGPK